MSDAPPSSSIPGLTISDLTFPDDYLFVNAFRDTPFTTSPWRTDGRSPGSLGGSNTATRGSPPSLASSGDSSTSDPTAPQAHDAYYTTSEREAWGLARALSQTLLLPPVAGPYTSPQPGENINRSNDAYPFTHPLSAAAALCNPGRTIHDAAPSTGEPAQLALEPGELWDPLSGSCPLPTSSGHAGEQQGVRDEHSVTA
jgi:hypothetical protein